MQGFGIVIIAILIGLVAGCLLGTQPSVNGQLGKYLEHPLQATDRTRWCIWPFKGVNRGVKPF